MSAITVARKEFNDARRSRVLLGVVALFVLSVGVVTYLLVEFLFTGAGQDLTSEQLTAATVAFLSGIITQGIAPIGVLIPAIGLLLGYDAISGERESGRIKLLLGLPHSRRDVVLGKLLGRTAVAAVAVVAGFLAATVVLLAFAGGVSPGAVAVLLVVTLVFAAVYVSIGIAVSALSPSSGWAVGLALGVVALFQLLWGAIFLVLEIVFFRDLAPGEPLPAWVRGIRSASPPDAYRKAVIASLETLSDVSDFGPGQGSNLGAPSDAPLYLQDWFGFVWLALWAVVPLAVGYLRFRDADLT